MKDEIKFFIAKILILYLILSFFPVVKLEFVKDTSTNIMIQYIVFFFKNLLHLWYLKIPGVIILAIASIKTKKLKEEKYKNLRK